MNDHYVYVCHSYLVMWFLVISYTLSTLPVRCVVTGSQTVKLENIKIFQGRYMEGAKEFHDYMRHWVGSPLDSTENHLHCKE